MFRLRRPFSRLGRRVVPGLCELRYCSQLVTQWCPIIYRRFLCFGEIQFSIWSVAPVNFHCLLIPIPLVHLWPECGPNIWGCLQNEFLGFHERLFFSTPTHVDFPCHRAANVMHAEFAVAQDRASSRPGNGRCDDLAKARNAHVVHATCTEEVFRAQTLLVT